MGKGNNRVKVEKHSQEPFANIYWQLSKNERDENAYGSSGENKELVESFSIRQWFPHESVSVYAIDEKGIQLALKERQSLLNELTAQQTEKQKEDKEYQSPELAVFRQLYMDGKGKIITPKYYGNSGFRRSRCFFDGMVKRYREGLDFHGRVPVIVKVYSDEVDRIIDQQIEKGLKDIGRVEIPDNNNLAIVKKLFDLGTIEARIREIFKTTMAQKLYGICKADRFYPELNIYKRFFLPKDDENHIPITRVLHSTIVELNNRTEATRKRLSGEVLSEKEKKLATITQEEMAQYFSGLRTAAQSGNEKKIMKKEEIKAKKDNVPIDLFKHAYTSVYDNTNAPILPYMDYADTINKATRLIDDGKPTALASAVSIAEMDGATEFFSKVLSFVERGFSLADVLKHLNSMDKNGKPANKSANK